MDESIADDLEVFIGAGTLWDAEELGALVARLSAETATTEDPLPARLGRFLEAVRLRQRVADVDPPTRAEIEAIVYPRLWKVIEAVRDGLPDSELRTRIEVMNRRLARLFVEESVGVRRSTVANAPVPPAAAGRVEAGTE